MSYEEFKKRIDTARQILVGAVPSPAGQIDQITYALMYKFMNDIDDQSASLGGKRSYFVGDYAKYNWHELMSSTLGAHERLELYRSAIQTMAKNENIPELFRSIYQNAFLPFNSANVLTLFLKEIDKFAHGESDDIGDAYEYLLSITGAQGDVGQFRTPRHIIKFIVEAVNPTKDDKVLDPACGTAGFLISAYSHVRAQHDGKSDTGERNDEKRLTSDELAKIHHNYRGFDIDPTMVRTAKVNMYLHGFKTPDIINHDSLSSEDYWTDMYDVVLANPPFMTPKGGIQPHKKFSITANRAEVLFVDYIASHLKPNGRAGIVVPEGIIFSGGKAYKELRKNLVENSLYAVVSLPAGVFNPYAGVKTSVLLLDKELAKQRDEILFVKISKDGFNLNAQRSKLCEDYGDNPNLCPVHSDLPHALDVLEKFKLHESFDSELAHKVKRSVIAEDGDYNLSSGRYKEVVNFENRDYLFHAIEELVNTISATNKIKTTDVRESGAVPVVDQSQKYIAGYTDDLSAKISDVPIVAFGDHTKSIKYIDFPFAQGADGIKILKPKDESQLVPRYLYYAMSNMEMPDKGYSRHWSDVKRIKIPLPPIEIQREIVAELDGYQKIIDSATTIVKTYKPTIKINPDWETKPLKALVELNPQKSEIKDIDGSTKVSFVPMAQLSEESADFIEQESKEISEVYKGYTYFRDNDVLLAKVTPCFENGKSGVARNLTNGIGFGSSEFYVLRASEQILPELIYNFISSSSFINSGVSHMTGTGGLQRLTKDYVLNTRIPLPPLETQQKIVAELEAEQKLIDASKKLIEIYQQKIRTKIAEIWGE